MAMKPQSYQPCAQLPYFTHRDMSERQQPSKSKQTETGRKEEGSNRHDGGYYRFCFRQSGQEYTAFYLQDDLADGSCVIIKTDHGLEPARIIGRAATIDSLKEKRRSAWVIKRRAAFDEEERYARLPAFELEGLNICRNIIQELKLPMHLVRVERYFDGSKIIFYFTANNRVDFRELVKRLVSDFRTRVEMRQIGVRHEAQMLGGLGPCGREFCCSSFLKKFGSVSIKMAKTQDLPLNPAKISGVCNRLFCCLSYEYDSYRLMKQGMPKAGSLIRYEGIVYRVIRQLALQGNILAITEERKERIFTEAEWRASEALHKPRPKSKLKSKRKKRTRRPGKKNQADTKDKKT